MCDTSLNSIHQADHFDTILLTELDQPNLTNYRGCSLTSRVISIRKRLRQAQRQRPLRGGGARVLELKNQ